MSKCKYCDVSGRRAHCTRNGEDVEDIYNDFCNSWKYDECGFYQGNTSTCPYCHMSWGGSVTCKKSNEVVNDSTYYDYCKRYYARCDKYSGHSSIGCFLTTACCVYKGLTDDCYYLETLRDFRDNYIAKLDGGTRIINEYYNVAPRIIQAISESGDTSVYERIFEDVIIPCVRLIELNENDAALEKYMEMVIDLECNYL